MVKYWLLALSILAILTACSESQNPADTPGSTGTVIDSFGANPVPSPINIGTQFSWTVYGQNLVCQLDVEGDGTVDYTVENCTSQSRVSHTYGVQGSFNARLSVTGADGETRQATTPVQVVAANIPPAPQLAANPPAATGSNPLAVVFSWQVNDANADVTHCRFDAQSDGVWEYDGLCAGQTSTSSEVKASNVVQYNFNFTYPKVGKYKATLEARDPYSANSTTVQVRAPYNRNPEITTFTATPGENKLATIEFAVNDPDGDALDCTLVVESIGTFRFSNCAEALRRYTFKAEGSYLVSLVVTDLLGGRVTASRVVTFGSSNKIIAEPTMAVSYQSSCFLAPVGKVYCWGDNEEGQLGDGTNNNASTPQLVKTDARFKQLAGGYKHMCALTEAGEAYCWGNNSSGVLGDNSETTRSTVPVAVQTAVRFTQISLGSDFTCGLAAAGDVYCWGSGSFGALGQGGTDWTSSKVPIKVVTGGVKFVQISSGYYHVCGLTAGGDTYCWGGNDNGEVGIDPDDTFNPSTWYPIYFNSPQKVAQGYAFKSLITGGYFTCGLKSDGKAFCWGLNDSGNLGSGDSMTKNYYTPREVVGSQFDRHYSGTTSAHSCGIKADGETWCWGYDYYGQLGIGTTDKTTNQNTPQKIANYTFRQISTSEYHTCGYTMDDKLMCWGWNTYGQLGNGVTTGESSNAYPLLVNPLP